MIFYFYYTRFSHNHVLVVEHIKLNKKGYSADSFPGWSLKQVIRLSK